MNTDDKEEQQPTDSSPKKPKVKRCPSRGSCPDEGDGEASAPCPRRCPICGATIVWVNNYTQHLKSKKHRDALYVLTEQFDYIH